MKRSFLVQCSFAALLLAFIMSFVQPARAEDRIAHIKVEGSQRIETETVLSYIDIQPGDPFDADRLNTALKALFATGLFADVSLYQEANDLVIVVVENPVINEIRFEGNDKIKKDALETEVQLKPRMVLTRTKVQADVERLQNVYRLSGRFSATIEPKIIKLDQNRVNLVFEITEGPKTYIAHISFLGNRHYDDGTLQKVVRSKEERWWRVWSDDDKYDPDRLDYDRELLRKFYLEHGYADFNVQSAIAELSPDRKNFYVTYSLDEGERYKVGTLEVKSNIAGFDATLLKDIPTFKSGDWYNVSEVEKTITKLTDKVNSLHYPFVEIAPAVDRQRDKKVVNLVFNVNPGKKVFVENINVNGNVRTLDEVIRREMTMNEGDPFNRAKLKESEQRIKDLGFFETATVKPSEGSAPDKVNVDVDVAEKSTGSISIGGGFSTTDGAVADFQLREKNFLGKGQDVVFATTVSTHRTEFDFSFTEPYFLKRDLSAGIDLFHSTTDHQDQSSYDTQRTGGGLRLGYPLSEHWRQGIGYRYEQNDITNIPASASTYIKQQAGNYSTSAISQRVTYDTTDSKLEPTEGLIARIDTELTGLGGDSSYVKLRTGGTYYYPVIDKWIFSALAEGGYIFGYGGKDVRINERYYIGGDTLRGFDTAGIGPRDSVTKDALGANHFWRGSLQLDTPSGLPEDLGVRIHGFTDFGAAGGVDDNGANIFDQDSIRLSLGAGISWKSPAGPVTVDFAKAIMKEDLDKTQFFRFSFGTRF